MAEIILPPEENEESPQVPELNIDKPTENSKVIAIEFEVKKTNKISTKDTNQQLYTTDTDAWFEFKETSLEGANGTYSVVFRNGHDGSIFQRTGDVVNGVAYYKIPEQEIRHAGEWRGQLVYTLENGDTTAREFGYDVKGHILDGKDVREIVVEDFETLMSQLNSMKDNAKLELADLVNAAERNELERQQFYESLVEDINDLQANYQELLDTGVLQTNINEKLEELEEEYAPRLNEVTAQLAHKITQGVGGVFSADLSQEVKEQLTGGSVAVVGRNAVLEENVVNGQITEKKTNFFTMGKNLFDKTSGLENKRLVWSHGGLNDTDNYFTSGPIDVEDYRGMETVANLKDTDVIQVFYGHDNSYITGYSTSTTPNTRGPLPIPQNAKWARISFPIGYINEMQLEIGSESTDYEPYRGYKLKDSIFDNGFIDLSHFNSKTADVLLKADGINWGLNGTLTGNAQDFIYSRNGEEPLYEPIGILDKLGVSIQDGSSLYTVLEEGIAGDFGIGLTFRPKQSTDTPPTVSDTAWRLLHAWLDSENFIEFYINSNSNVLTVNYWVEGTNYQFIVPNIVVDKDETVSVYLHISKNDGMFIHWLQNDFIKTFHHIRRDLPEPKPELRQLAIGHRLRVLTQKSAFFTAIFSDIHIDFNNVSPKKYFERVWDNG